MEPKHVYFEALLASLAHCFISDFSQRFRAMLENLTEKISSCFLDAQIDNLLSYLALQRLTLTYPHSHLRPSVTTAFKPLFLSPNLIRETLPFAGNLTNGDFQPLLSVMLFYHLYYKIFSL